MKKRVADIVMEILVDNGIVDCFAVVGGGAMHLDNALALNSNIHKYFNHHEQACAMAAEGYARYAGKIAAVCVTSGPGAVNTLTGVVGAWQDSIPMLILSGQVRYEISVEKTGLPLRYRGMQEFDIINSVQNMTKYAVMVRDPLEIKRELQKAIDIALSGRRGPTWLDIPLDIQSAIIEENDLYPCEEPPQLPQPQACDLEQMMETLQQAKRPCILLGAGIASSCVFDLTDQFVTKMNIPTLGGAWLSDAFYTNHPLYYGTAGNTGPRTGNFILQNADVILCLGNSLSYKQTGFNLDGFAPNAKIIMVDIDENEAKKPGLRIHQLIHTELSLFFNAFLKDYSGLTCSTEWLNYCERLKKRFNAYEATEHLDMQERVCTYYFWKQLEEVEPEDCLVVLGNSSSIMAKLQAGKKTSKQRIMTNYTCGSMGYDLPGAIGVAVASKRPVICCTGEGSVMMNIQELQTIRQYHLPIKIAIFENDGYNAIRQTCKNFFHGVEMGCSAESGISFPAFKDVASVFGMDYHCCHTNEEVKESVDWLIAKEEASILELKQRYNDPVTPRLMSRLRPDGSMTEPLLQDMYPFIPEEELKELMFKE